MHSGQSRVSGPSSGLDTWLMRTLGWRLALTEIDPALELGGLGGGGGRGELFPTLASPSPSGGRIVPGIGRRAYYLSGAHA